MSDVQIFEDCVSLLLEPLEFNVSLTFYLLPNNGEIPRPVPPPRY
jgi:hypothetical protein